MGTTLGRVPKFMIYTTLCVGTLAFNADRNSTIEAHRAYRALLHRKPRRLDELPVQMEPRSGSSRTSSDKNAHPTPLVKSEPRLNDKTGRVTVDNTIDGSSDATGILLSFTGIWVVLAAA